MAKRLGFVDALRGYAALYVLVFHVSYSPVPNLPTPTWLTPIVFYGFSGVTLFFVVSAFSLCLTMPRHISTGAPVSSFAISRFFRIAPLFYVLIIYSVARDAGWFVRAPDLGEALVSASFLFNIVPGRFNIVWGGWTIGVEMLFYAVFPFIYFKANGHIVRLILCLFLSIALYMSFKQLATMLVSQEDLYRVTTRSIFRHLPTFMIGMITYYVYTHIVAMQETLQRNWGIVSFVVSGVLFYIQIYNRHVLYPLPEIGDALAYSSLLLGLGLIDVPSIVNPIARYYGLISYSLYLWHLPVIWTLTPLLRSIYERVETPTAFLLSSAVILAVATGVAHVSYRLIERPGEKIGRRLICRLLSRANAPQPAPSPS